ncbi:MAG: hypothetical protein H6697_02605 [Myxococcales bacterium]|nr:hypothetical protein [Myxococcales bacterium]MCB9521342.1 hypothetical protein [Myxococcales bacterium]
MPTPRHCLRRRLGVVPLAFLTLPTVACSENSEAQPEWVDPSVLTVPPDEARPWVRYWWPGGDVSEAMVAADVQQIAAAGFGGVELQAFDAALDPALRELPEDPVGDVLTETFERRVASLVAAAEASGIDVDLTIGSGWPPGGAHVAPEDALTTWMWREYVATGPALIQIGTPRPTPTLFYTIADIAAASFGERLARFEPELAHLVVAYAVPVVGGARSPSPLDIDDTVAVDLTHAVDVTQDIATGGEWTAPAGSWTIVAVFAAPDGEYITLTAQRGDPRPVDPLDAAAFERTLAATVASAPVDVHGIFFDSLELKADRLTTDDMLEEFERRRGYPLGSRLLTVLEQGADSFLLEAGQVRIAPEFSADADDERVRWDYDQTVSDLFIERAIEAPAAWAAARGWTLRGQPYGIDVDLLEAAAATPVPEAETLYAGGSAMFLRAVAAGAALGRRSLVSAEAFSFAGRDHMTTPAKVRAMTDHLLANGVTQLVFHGWAYPADGDYGVTGWTPFSSPFGGSGTFASNFGPGWEFAEALPDLTRYTARAQELMRTGSPDADVLVWLPFRGFPTSLALLPSHVEPLLGGYMPGAEPELRELPFASLAALLGTPTPDPRAEWLARIWPVLDELEAAGLSWSWVSAGTADRLMPTDGRLTVGADAGSGSAAAATYGQVLVYEADSMPLDAAETLATWAGAGVPVTIVGSRPASTPSLGDGPSADGRVAALLGDLPLVDVAAVVETLRRTASPCAVPVSATPVRATVRAVDGAPRVVLFRNSTPERAESSWSVRDCPRAVVYDAWTDSATDVETESLALALAPYTSRFLLCDAGPLRGRDDGAAEATGESLEIAGWTVTATSATGLFETANVELTEPLPDWRDVPTLRSLAGPAVYRGSFDLASACSDAWIELDTVYGTVSATVDGNSANTHYVGPWTLPVGALTAGPHAVELAYIPPLRNELLAAGDAGAAAYAQHAGKEDTAIAVGVVGDARVRCMR